MCRLLVLAPEYLTAVSKEAHAHIANHPPLEAEPSVDSPFQIVVRLQQERVDTFCMLTSQSPHNTGRVRCDS